MPEQKKGENLLKARIYKYNVLDWVLGGHK